MDMTLSCYLSEACKRIEVRKVTTNTHHLRLLFLVLPPFFPPRLRSLSALLLLARSHPSSAPRGNDPIQASLAPSLPPQQYHMDTKGELFLCTSLSLFSRSPRGGR